MLFRRRLWNLVGSLIIVALLIGACAPAASPAAAPQAPAGNEHVVVAQSLENGHAGSSLFGGIALMVGLVAVAVTVFIAVSAQAKWKHLRGRVTALVTALLLLAILFGSSYVPIDAGQVGVVITQGQATRTLNPGPNWVAPFFEEVVTMNTRDVTYIAMSKPATQGDNQEYRDFTIDFMSADFVKVAVPYTAIGHLDSSKAIQVYNDYGSLRNMMAKVVADRGRIIGRELLQQYDAKELITRVDEMSGRFYETLGTEAGKAGFVLLSVGFRKPSLGVDDAYGLQLDAEKQAMQNAAVERKNVDVKKALADQAIETERGNKGVTVLQAEARAESTLAEQKATADANLYSAKQAAEQTKLTADATAYKILTEAKAQAQANDLVGASLNPFLILMEQAKRWTGNVPMVVSSGNGTPFLFNLPVGTSLPITNTAVITP